MTRFQLFTATVQYLSQRKMCEPEVQATKVIVAIFIVALQIFIFSIIYSSFTIQVVQVWRFRFGAGGTTGSKAPIGWSSVPPPAFSF